MDYKARQRHAREALAREGVSALLVTHLPNVRYLCGFTGSAGALLLTAKQVVFFTDGRYGEQARAEVRGARVFVSARSALAAAAEWLRERGLAPIGFESEHTTVAERDALQHALGRRARLRPAAAVVERLREVKQPAEIAALRRAVLLGSRLFPVALRAIRRGATERAVAAALEHAARLAGADGMSFETIVAAGRRSARPHGVASAAPIPRRGFVVLDFGVILGGYCSDMTRTVHVGEPPAEARRMYEAVLRAQRAAIAAIRPGITAGEVDQAARGVLAEAGYGKFFTHSTGHGVGLEIHEPPRLGNSQCEQLVEGMVVTVEPGIYIPGRGGVRIEDMVVVTRHGCRILTPTTKELITLRTVPVTR